MIFGKKSANRIVKDVWLSWGATVFQKPAPQLFSILPPSITSEGLLCAFNCPRPLWDNNMICFSVSLLFWVWMLWREGTHQALSRTQGGEWLIHQQEPYHMLTLTFRQKPIPVLCIRYPSQAFKTAVIFIRSETQHTLFQRDATSSACNISFHSWVWKSRKQLNIKDKGYKSEHFQIRGKLLQRQI